MKKLIRKLHKLFFFTITGFIFLWVGGFLWFASKIQTEAIELRDYHTDAIVVFTGSPGRLLEGVKLIDSNLAPLMFVTGVNKSSLKNTQKWLQKKTDKYECCIELDTVAKNTAGNARETAKWINKKENIKSIRIVTAPYHLLRSFTELNRHIPKEIKILKHPVNDSRYPNSSYFNNFSSILLLSSEYTKYLVALIRYRIEE